MYLILMAYLQQHAHLAVVTRELQFSIILGDPYDISDCTNGKHAVTMRGQRIARSKSKITKVLSKCASR